MKNHLKLAAIVVFAAAASAAHAGIVEELLAVPAIQSLLGRVPELQAAVQRCANAGFRQRNIAICEQAEAAARLARIPPELRTLLSNPAAASSIRELCLAVQSGALQNSYLCAELAKADIGFRALMDQRRQMPPPAPVPPREGGESGHS